ncbi:MAG TPA: cache domain-containing protein [Thermoanaerobaculaceae bacterium]|nr:cache domain-containing protein [Thermoanaerobaculaceae bacterium]HRS17382.1 cache domain-containing protein [Thermoanaerobaculaceae bacterium]
MRLPKALSIQHVLLAAMGTLILLAIAVIGYLWISEEWRRFEVDAERQRRDYVDAQKAMIRNEVEKVTDYIAYRRSRSEEVLRATLRSRVLNAVATAESLYRVYSGSMPRPALESLIREALRPIRFDGGRGYIFAVAMDGTEQLYPTEPGLEGTSLLDLQAANGQLVVREEIELMRRQEEGFVVNLWRRPGTPDGMVHPKMTFLKRFQPLGWFFGCGEYLEDFDRDLQDELLERISRIRFGKEGYVFVNTYDGDALITDGQRVREHRNLWELTDPGGVKVIQEERRAVEKPGGDFIYYTWNKLTEAVPAKKVSFVKSVPDWRWMVGAGVYLDEIEPVIEALRKELRRETRRQMVKVSAIVVSLGLAVLLIARVVSLWMRRGLAAFVRFFERGATESIPIDESRLAFSEFRSLAHAANAMIEARRKAEGEKRELEDKLAHARKMEALGLLAGGVAHDLNNILSGVVLYPDLLLAQFDANSPLRRPLESIRESGMRAAAVVADLLLASRGGTASAEVLNLGVEVERFLASPELHALALQHPRVRLRVDLDPDPPNFRCSPAHLAKTLLNLVANAMEAIAEEGEVVLRAERRRLAEPRPGYETVPVGEYAVLVVQDSGSGIPPEDLARIFDPFFTRKILGRRGTGLGLTVVWHTVHDHGGYIDVRSGAGTTFELFFPASGEPVTGSPSVHSVDELRGRGERILVVDDEPSQRELASELLSRLGYEPHVASSGEEALEMVEAAPYDLLVLDMILGPGMDGRATYAAILAVRPGQKAIIASGYAETEDIRATLAMGAGAAVLKPYTLERMGAAIRKELER